MDVLKLPTDSKSNFKPDALSFDESAGQGGNSLYAIGVGIKAAGVVSSAGEYSNVINGRW